LPARAAPLRHALRAATAGGVALDLSLATSGGRVGAGVAVVDGERFAFDEVGGGVDEEFALADPRELRIAPVPRLLLLGSGPETPPLLAATRRLGWQVTVCEHRERWQRFAEGSGVDSLQRDGIDALPALLATSRFDAALVMNHHFELDARALRALADADVSYIGLLGPAARRDELLADIGEDTATRLHPRLRAPVGLALGGEGAEAIALAIAAELQQVFAQGSRD
jgi:xanthine dehydrogenase accessory factor